MLGRRTAAAPCAMVLAPLAAHLSLFAGFMDLGPGWGHSDTQPAHLYKSN